MFKEKNFFGTEQTIRQNLGYIRECKIFFILRFMASVVSELRVLQLKCWGSKCLRTPATYTTLK